MRVNSIDDTNFKMALKLNAEKMPKVLKEKSIEYTTVLDEFGNKIKDIKLYNVVFTDSFIPQVKSADSKITKDYFKALREEEQILGKWYEIPQGVEGDSVGGFYPKEPKIFRTIYGENAAKEYAEFKKLSVYEQAGELSRLLELRDLKKLIAHAKKESEQRVDNIIEMAKIRQHEEIIDNLINKYAYTEPELQPEEKTTGFFKKIFGKLFS